MAFNITLRIYQTVPAHGYFSIVEKTNWNYANGGTWSDTNGIQTLTMGGSGTSGVLRFLSDQGEYITVAVGVHNNLRWCDVVTGLAAAQTALVINGEYYDGGGRDNVREGQSIQSNAISPNGTAVTVVYTVFEGNNLQANIIFA